VDNSDQTRARLAALFDAPSAPESQPTTQQATRPVNKFSVWQPEARIRAYTLLLTLERIGGDDAALSRFGQLAEQIGSAMEQEERAQASREASQNMLTLSAALHCGR
jgi:hypothetical protein